MSIEQRKKRRIVCVVIGVLIIGAGILILGIYRVRGSARIVSMSDSMPSKVMIYSQQDTRWKEDKLGDSQYTIGTSGCITTCLAAAFQMQEIEVEDVLEVNPQSLNDYFSQNGVYDEEGNLQWSVLESLIDRPVIREGVTSTSAQQIEQLLSCGIYPICRVRMPWSGKGHYVLIVGSKEGEFRCMDPMSRDDEPVSLKHYHNRIYAIRYIGSSVTGWK